ncbi:MAG TPA: alpha-ribazole phosphatase [Firmicutes bacterium]|jgi:alpha-ribazole phosphatase|nr:alpha-ribazole phosphatase [Bacillota bacterium]
MVELILVRHGETCDNQRGAFLGWTDPELNETGLGMAHAIREKLANNSLNAIFSSPLKRAFQTARIINEINHIEIQTLEALKERNFGLWDNLTLADIRASYPTEARLWLNNPDYPIPDGESIEQFNRRIIVFLNELLHTYSCGRVLLVTHGGCIRTIIAHLLGLKAEDCWRFKINVGSITKLEVAENHYGFLTLLNG